MKFLKMHGLGNDFVILDFRQGADPLSPERIRLICDRHFGVGCDQLVVMEPSEQADVFARFYNGDGSESGACGNATRCVAEIIIKEKQKVPPHALPPHPSPLPRGERGQQYLESAPSPLWGEGRGEGCIIETTSGLLPATRAENGMITVDMGVPKLDWREIPLSKPSDTLALPLDGTPVCVNMGNPHCVFFVDNLADIPVETLGAQCETDPLFPERTNVEFVQVIGENRLRQITWERGVGLTLACGSGACAVAVAAVRRGLTGRKVEIVLDGGSLTIEWRESDSRVLMTGPVASVFEGCI